MPSSVMIHVWPKRVKHAGKDVHAKKAVVWFVYMSSSQLSRFDCPLTLTRCHFVCPEPLVANLPKCTRFGRVVVPKSTRFVVKMVCVGESKCHMSVLTLLTCMRIFPAAKCPNESGRHYVVPHTHLHTVSCVLPFV